MADTTPQFNITKEAFNANAADKKIIEGYHNAAVARRGGIC